MDTTIAIVVGLLVVAAAAVLILAANKPDRFHIERAIRINAPAEKIFPLINDFRNWVAWSPWEKKDPALKRTYGGAQSGTGATYAWEGDRNVGQGRMEIAEASAPSRIVIKLDFIKPFEAHNIVTFTLAPQGDATHVTWAMDGPNLFIGKVISVFMSMDRMVGKDFETGLANLKSAAERRAAETTA